MRLIDADALVAKIWEKHKKVEDTYDLCVDEVKDILCGIVSIIDEQPTAYDLDKIAKALDKASDYCESNEQDMEHVQMLRLVDAVDIVKGGGVDAF